MADHTAELLPLIWIYVDFVGQRHDYKVKILSAAQQLENDCWLTCSVYEPQLNHCFILVQLSDNSPAVCVAAKLGRKLSVISKFFRDYVLLRP